MKSEMRGGPRLMCSPYLTGSLGVMLVLVGFNYWSVSTQNYDLLTRIQQMQSQLGIGSEKIEEIEKKEQTLVSSLRTKDSDLAECRNEKNELKKQNTYQRTSKEKTEERLQEEIEKKKSALHEKEGLQTDVNRLTEEKDALQVQIDTLHDDIAKKDNRTAELGHKLEEIRAQYNQNRNQEELKEEGFKVANIPSDKLEGQLPDVNPAAVKIERANNEALSSNMATIAGYETTYLILTPGHGDQVVKGKTVTVHATGVVKETGKKFWSTKDVGQKPFTYRAGVGEVITGWDQGLLGMRLGEERMVIIPTKEGAGAAGFPAWGIPPGATLEFTLEVLQIQ